MFSRTRQIENIPGNTADGLLQLVAAHPKFEICGFIFRDWSIWQADNVAKYPHRQFEIDPRRQLELVKEYRKEILGIYHSHPSGSASLSIEDKMNWPAWPARYWVVTDHHVTEWVKQDDRFIRAHVTPAI